ncbi:MAG: hypothetical protein ACETWM_11695 [Candidatus Lokiarchaeia archaeon]
MRNEYHFMACARARFLYIRYAKKKNSNTERFKLLFGRCLS